MEEDEFFLPGDPPRTTAQEKQVAIVNGKPVFYEPKKIRDAKYQLMQGLYIFSPETPLEGAIELFVRWQFPSKSHKDGEWKITRPDTDNLEKLLKDCMTRCGFWKDDAQVVKETCEKVWSSCSGIYIRYKRI